MDDLSPTSPTSPRLFNRPERSLSEVSEITLPPGDNYQTLLTSEVDGAEEPVGFRCPTTPQAPDVNAITTITEVLENVERSPSMLYRVHAAHTVASDALSASNRPSYTFENGGRTSIQTQITDSNTSIQAAIRKYKEADMQAARVEAASIVEEKMSKIREKLAQKEAQAAQTAAIQAAARKAKEAELEAARREAARAMEEKMSQLREVLAQKEADAIDAAGTCCELEARNCELTAKVADLEAKMAKQMQDKMSQLKETLAQKEADAMAKAGTCCELEAKNCELSTKVGDLEAQLAKQMQAAKDASIQAIQAATWKDREVDLDAARRKAVSVMEEKISQLREELAQKEADGIEAVGTCCKLEAQNRELAAKVADLQAQTIALMQDMTKTPPIAVSEPQSSIEERLGSQKESPEPLEPLTLPLSSEPGDSKPEKFDLDDSDHSEERGAASSQARVPAVPEKTGAKQSKPLGEGCCVRTSSGKLGRIVTYDASAPKGLTYNVYFSAEPRRNEWFHAEDLQYIQEEDRPNGCAKWLSILISIVFIVSAIYSVLDSGHSLGSWSGQHRVWLWLLMISMFTMALSAMCSCLGLTLFSVVAVSCFSWLVYAFVKDKATIDAAWVKSRGLPYIGIALALALLYKALTSCKCRFRSRASRPGKTTLMEQPLLFQDSASSDEVEPAICLQVNDFKEHKMPTGSFLELATTVRHPQGVVAGAKYLMLPFSLCCGGGKAIQSLLIFRNVAKDITPDEMGRCSLKTWWDWPWRLRHTIMDIVLCSFPVLVGCSTVLMWGTWWHVDGHYPRLWQGMFPLMTLIGNMLVVVAATGQRDGKSMKRLEALPDLPFDENCFDGGDAAKIEYRSHLDHNYVKEVSRGRVRPALLARQLMLGMPTLSQRGPAKVLEKIYNWGAGLSSLIRMIFFLGLVATPKIYCWQEPFPSNYRIADAFSYFVYIVSVTHPHLGIRLLMNCTTICANEFARLENAVSSLSRMISGSAIQGVPLPVIRLDRHQHILTWVELCEHIDKHRSEAFVASQLGSAYLTIVVLGSVIVLVAELILAERTLMLDLARHYAFMAGMLWFIPIVMMGLCRTIWNGMKANNALAYRLKKLQTVLLQQRLMAAHVEVCDRDHSVNDAMELLRFYHSTIAESQIHFSLLSIDMRPRNIYALFTTLSGAVAYIVTCIGQTVRSEYQLALVTIWHAIWCWIESGLGNAEPLKCQ